MPDWGNLISALAGAGITFAVTIYERRVARKDARQARHDAIEDERRRDRDRYARDAVEVILHGVEDRFSLRRSIMEEERDYDKADELVRLFYHQAVYIPEPAVRSLIEEAARLLDYRARLAEVGVDLREIVFQVRRMLHEVLGSWLRGETIPALEPRYIKIRDAFDKLPKRPTKAKEDVGKPRLERG